MQEISHPSIKALLRYMPLNNKTRMSHSHYVNSSELVNRCDACCLGVTLITKWVHNGLRGDVDFAHVTLVAVDILLQRQKQTLSMLWSEYHAALNTCLG